MSSSSKQESFNYNFLFWFLIIQSMFFCLHSLQESSSTSSSKNDPNGGGRRIIKCTESEREALLNFKAGLITYPANLLSSWEGHQDDCCKWWGVSCNKNTTHVIGLNLRGTFDEYDNTYVRYLAGEITPSLLHLKHLRHLDLSFNNFSGTSIPKFIGSFRKLTYLNLSSSGFVGLVPPQLGNLSRLRYLDLGNQDEVYVGNSRLRYLDLGNQDDMHVDNLRWLPRLSSLKYLDMTYVNLRSVVDWFQMVNMLPSLTTLNLESCFLPSIPTSSLSYINFSTSLNTLDLSYNHFNSSLPQWIWNISSLTNLYLGSNSFHGPIPDAGSLVSLEVLDLSYNNLDGIIPIRKITNLCRLTFLDLSDNNNLRGDIGGLVDSVWNCTHPMLQTLELAGNQLSGKLTSGIQHMRRLNTLGLSYNQLHGPIPVEIGKLSQLSYIDLSNNQLHGPIPVEIGMLSQLSVIDLSDNQLHGPIPVEIGMLSQLSYIHLSNNQLHGPIPVEVGNLSQLSYIDLSNNQLHGPIPVEIGMLSQLFVIDLSNNSFSGLVTESHFTNLTNLNRLILSMNPLTFSVDESWVPPFQLEEIELASCKLGPHFPSWLHNQMEIPFLIMSNCSISTIVPDWFWNKLCPSIYYLDLSNNLISGRLPKNLEIAKYGEVHLDSNRFEGYVPSSLLSNAQYLHLSNNLFSGSIPNIEVSHLTNLDLSNNHFNSSIPASLCKVAESLDLSNNSFSGEIPNQWQIQSTISIINLANNHFSGRVPNSLGLVTNLEVLILRHNNLSGQFPSFLQSCDGLKFLDLSQNNFYGIIPTWLGENLTSLSFLSLRSNFFSGNIPLQFGQFQNLAFMDLANNKLSGLIPHCFGNLSAMASTLVTNIIPHYEEFGRYYEIPIYFSLLEFTKGEELEFMKNHYFMQSIDLSDNYLTGEIPEEIGALIGLMNLNLSSNRLIGNIPEHIGRMRSLESLDLSRNELSGNIPLSISDLNFLSYLNLSYNHLSGKIPSGNQIQTLSDPSIYAGNIGLCGPPLPTNCSSSRSDTENNGEYVKGDEERVWLYYSIGLGYIVGFWAACGVLLFNKTWRRAYFQFFDNSYDWFYVEVSLALTKLKSARVGRN